MIRKAINQLGSNSSTGGEVAKLRDELRKLKQQNQNLLERLERLERLEKVDKKGF